VTADELQQIDDMAAAQVAALLANGAFDSYA
jgi:hypothetical protein